MKNKATTSIVSLKNVSINYGNYKVLDTVNLEIFTNDFIGIIGPNGGGKTTLIKAILGMIPYEGEIIISDSLRGSGHTQIGYMPQISSFDKSFPISVLEVVISGLQGQKKLVSNYNESDYQRANDLLRMSGIESIADKPIGEISGGQMQRALLCRAVISNPKLLILDEPTNFVDNKYENELYTTLNKLNDHMAIVMISHDIGTITSVVKSIVCVNKHVHRHNSNIITNEQLINYDCPIQIVSHGHVPHTILANHKH